MATRLKKGLMLIFQLIVTVLVVLGVASVFQFVVVRGDSMEPTCHDGDFLICIKADNIASNDIVIFNDSVSRNLLCKRVIGVSQDTVTLHGNRVSVNGYMLDEPYLLTQEWDSGMSLEVPNDSVFLLGDNRNDSRDSRHFGVVPTSSIKGVVLCNITKQFGLSYKIIQRSVLVMLGFLLGVEIFRGFHKKFGNNHKLTEIDS